MTELAIFALVARLCRAVQNLPPAQRVQETLPSIVLNSLEGQKFHDFEPAVPLKQLIAHFEHSVEDTE